MKLATYRTDQGSRIGIVDTDTLRLFELSTAAARLGLKDAPFGAMLELIDADDAGLELARTVVAKRGDDADLWRELDRTELLAPLPQPRLMRDAMSFATHIRQSGRGARALQALQTNGRDAFNAAMQQPLDELADVYRELPIYYLTNHLMVAGPSTTVRWPHYSQVMDYELEIAIITRRSRANIPKDEAGAHIFGYTVFNDFSARDKQFVEMQGRLGPAKGKSFEGSNVLGPWIVTPDELGDPENLRVEVRVNGEIRATGHTGGMLFSFEEILAYASQDETIHGAEVFGSGTVGNCCGLEIGRFLESGDKIELFVDRIGVLQNTVVRQESLTDAVISNGRS